MASIYLIVAAALIVIALLSNHSTQLISLGALIGGAAGHYIVAGLLSPWLARSHYKKYPLIRKPLFIGLTSEGITFKAENGGALLSWENMIKWRESEEFILVYPAPRIYHVIPKKLSAAGLDIGAISAALKENVGSAT